MAELNFKGPVFKVTMTEYERGYGQRPMGEKFFDSEDEARAFCADYNKDPGDPDCFYRADYSKIA